MITAQNLTKTFDKFTALENLNCSIPNGCIYGMVGSNGAGKSTLLRLITGIYRPDKGEVLIDGKRVYDNPEVKRRFVFVPDELYFLPQATMNRMAGLYKAVYPSFDDQRFKQLSQAFNLAPNVKLQTFSKGMKRQAATILALSAKPEFIFFDETFDGLDPVMRNLVKKVIYADVCERKATAVITSHSLRELEDTCDQRALLHKGGIIFESDIENLRTSLFKLQVAFSDPYDQSLFGDINIVSFVKKGSIASIIARGDKNDAVARIKALNPLLVEALPLTLEEVFIYEMEALGYSFEDALN